MEIRIYSREMKLQGIVENHTSLIWIRKYFENGEFELHVPITQRNLNLMAIGNLVYKKEASEAGIIESVQLEESNTKNEMTIKGRFLSAYLSGRIIRSTFSFTGPAETAIYRLCQEVTEIPLLTFKSSQNRGPNITLQISHKNVLDTISRLAKSSNLGFRIVPNFNERKMIFEVFEGAIRTKSQGVRNRVIFSEGYNNLNKAIYKYNNQLVANVAYVAGQGEGENRKIVKVGDSAGFDLKEIFIDARDLSPDKISTQEYEALLRQRGLEALAGTKVSESFECDTGADINFKYLQHYDLGDVVTVYKKAWGIEQDLRITEMQEVYEYGTRRLVPTLGSQLPTKLEDWR